MLFHLTPSAMAEGYGEALLPMSLAKAHLRVDGDDEDLLIAALRDAAIDGVEQYANLRMGPCTGIVATYDGFDHRAGMRLGVGPDFSVVVTGVSYVFDGTSTDLAAGGWRLGAGGRLWPPARSCWPRANGPVTVTFDAGYPAGTCPPSLLQAARLLLGHLYINREAIIMGTLTGEMPLGVTWWADRARMPVL